VKCFLPVHKENKVQLVFLHVPVEAIDVTSVYLLLLLLILKVGLVI